MWNRLGILTDEVAANLDEALTWIEEKGFVHVEIRMVNGVNIMQLDDEAVDEVRRKVESHGLYVSAIASPLYKCPLDPSRKVQTGDTFGQQAQEDVETHHGMLHRAIEIAQRLGTGNIRIFSFWREEQPELVEREVVAHLKRAAEIAEQKGAVLLLENEPSCNGGNAREVGRIAEQVASPALRVLWDPGNEAYAGYPAYPEGYEAVKNVLAHVHLKDALLVDGAPRCVPIGQGAVDFPGQLAALAEDGYEGLFTIETHYIPDGGTKAQGSELTLNGLKSIQGDL